MKQRILAAIGLMALVALGAGIASLISLVRRSPAPAPVEMTNPPAENESPRRSLSPRSEVATPPLTPNTELEQILGAALDSLPAVAQIKFDGARAGVRMPSEVLESARKFGKLAEYLESHPDAIPYAVPGYLSCALNSETFESLRALCAYRLDLYRSNWDTDTRARIQKIPAAITRLAEKLRDPK